MALPFFSNRSTTVKGGGPLLPSQVGLVNQINGATGYAQNYNPTSPAGLVRAPATTNVRADMQPATYATNTNSTGGGGGGSAYSSGPSAAQVAASQQAAKEAAAGRAINVGYDQVLGTYERQLASLPDQVNDAGAIVNSQYGTQQSGIESAYGVGNRNLQYARDDLGQKTGRTLRDLAGSMRNSFDSYSTMIGAGGGETHRRPASSPTRSKKRRPRNVPKSTRTKATSLARSRLNSPSLMQTVASS